MCFNQILYTTDRYTYNLTVTNTSTMPEYDADALVIGKYLTAFVQSTGDVSPVFERKTRNLFEDQLGELDPEGWYELGTVAELYKRLENDVGTATMRKGGVATGEALPIDTSNDIDAALEQLNTEHKQVYKNTDSEWPAGKYFIDYDGTRSARVGVDEAYPFPESFVEGVYDAFIKRYGPGDASPSMESVDPRSDERFVWHVDW